MILVLDFGSQYTQLIARRVREAGVYCEIHPFNAGAEKIAQLKPDGLILSGGPASVYDRDAPRIDGALLDGRPVLGICYGMGLLCQLDGGRVARADRREYGPAELLIDDDSDLFVGLGTGGAERVWMSHGDRMESMPRGYEAIAHSSNSPIAAFRDRSRRRFGVQFHPEVVHTPRGARSCRTSCSASAAARPTGRWRASSSARWRRIRERVGRGPGHLRAVGRGRFDGDGGARTARDRRPPDLRVRRQRPAAQERVRRSHARLPRALRLRPEGGRRFRALLEAPAGGGGSRAQAKDHRRDVHRGLRAGGALDSGRRVSRPGDALSRRHRIGVLQGALGDDQEPPQRRWPARAHAPDAHRAAARALQGRGAEGRRSCSAFRRRFFDANRFPDRVSPSACSAR